MAARFASVLGFAYLALAALAFVLFFWSRSRGHPHEYEAMGAAVLAVATLPLGVLFFLVRRPLRKGAGRWRAMALNVLVLLPICLLLVKALPMWKEGWELVVLNAGLLAFTALHLCSLATLFTYEAEPA